MSPSKVMGPDPESVFATDSAVHGSGLHVTSLGAKFPSVPHVTSPPPEYPGLQVTLTTSPVTPVMFPVSDLSEFGTSVA